MGFRFNPLNSQFNVVDGDGSFGSQSANKVFASPNGAPGLPTFRQLVSGDISSGSASVNYVLTSNGAGVDPSWKAAGGSGGATVLSAVYQDSGIQTVTGSWTVVKYATEAIDTDNAYNPATGIFTVPVDTVNVLIVEAFCFCNFPTWTAGATIAFSVWKNGAFFAYFVNWTAPRSAQYDLTMNGTAIIPVTGADQIEVRIATDNPGVDLRDGLAYGNVGFYGVY